MNATHPKFDKQAYYLAGAMKPALARRYWRRFEGATRVLDLGCGTGEFGRYRPSNVELHGLDCDSAAVQDALAFEVAMCVDLDSEPLPYESEYFDAVLAKDVLEHLDRPERIVREIHRVLRPGGLVVASVVVASPRRVWADYTHVRGYTPAAARLLLEDAGLSVEALWPMGGVPLSDRLHFMGIVPLILRLPIASQLWRSSWELCARKAGSLPA